MQHHISPSGHAETFIKWQTGEYARFLQIKHSFPISFLMLCKLAGVTPRQLLTDFVDNLSCSGWNRTGRDTPKAHLADYFISHGYGQQFYTAEDIREIFRDMDAVGRLFPHHDQETITIYCKWRNKHYKSWFLKWYHKNRRL